MATLIDIVTKASTDRSVAIRIIDSTDGTPETGVVWNTAGIDLWYRREGATKTSITEATLAALDTAHTDGGFLHISDGEYRLDLPDAAVATGANYVDIGGTVTGMIVIGGRIRLVNVDLEDTVRAGLTALPNAAANAAGGLPISVAGGLDLDTQIGTDIDAILTDTADMQPRVTAIEADTDELQTDDYPTSIAAVKADTAAILTDTGTTLQAELDGIQEDTEDLQTQIGTAGAGLTAMPWNASWDAEVQSEAADALDAYDPPTKTEMDSAHALLATPAQVNAQVVDVLTVDTLADSYATDGAQPTIGQAILAIKQFLEEKSISGTTVTVKKPDGSTAAMTFTLDDGDDPTSITRAT